jgi:uncharacterized protein
MYKDILTSVKNIAVYGMSKNVSKAAYTIPMYMKKYGFNIIPINPTTDKIAGMKCYRRLADVEEHIDMLNIFRPSEMCIDIVKEAIERKYLRADTNILWFQLGISNQEAKELAIREGFNYVEDKCIYVEYNNL